MIIEEFRNISSTRGDLRRFGLGVGAVLVLIGGFLLWRHKPAYPYFIGVGTALMGLGLLLPSALRPLQKIWMGFAVIMGWFMTRLIIGILFYLILTPLSLLIRLFGKRFLDLKIDYTADSYWYRREKPDAGPERYEKQF
jgi:hypothetical protein